MKKIALIIFAFLLNTALIFGQTQKGIKIYTNYFSDSYEITEFRNTDFTTQNFNFNQLGSISGGYVWQSKEKHWHEIEFGLAFDYSNATSQTTSGGVSLMTSGDAALTSVISSRYEWQYQLLKGKSVSFNLGSSSQLYWLHANQAPKISSNFPYFYNKVWLKLAVVPRVLFHFEKFALDINLPITFAQTGFDSRRIENPTLSPEEQTSYGFNFEILPNQHWFQARAGILWYL
jgi:hypothetical protein